MDKKGNFSCVCVKFLCDISFFSKIVKPLLLNLPCTLYQDIFKFPICFLPLSSPRSSIISFRGPAHTIRNLLQPLFPNQLFLTQDLSNAIQKIKQERYSAVWHSRTPGKTDPFYSVLSKNCPEKWKLQVGNDQEGFIRAFSN